ncbi:hypothetical protein HK100_005744 [Physocladia obscura]|uniref:Xaa-Pro dipeptidyl-peptidase-like domain-containing protein n=1 Tax=Physocladia obscura TaxID=109957 RepID=A0AAD5STF4_9FUNG|nr:hypothetical protein HK100_005744 [Physocladia obscura]
MSFSEQIALIPSTDSVQIEARIGMPTILSNATTTPVSRKDICVIVTHPYGRLGGNLHNNVVDAIVSAFGSAYITVRFNFRGIGQSTGRPSISGKGELDDLLSVWRYVRDRADLKPRSFILVGYSYGCIPVCAGASEIEGCIGIAAISFPASVMWFLTFGNSNKYLDALKSVSPDIPKLFIIGNRDNFTGTKSFLQFTETVPPRKQIEIIENQDHFWFGQESILIECIRKWIRQERIIPERTKYTPLPSLESLRDNQRLIQGQAQMKADIPAGKLLGAKSVDSLASKTSHKSNNESISPGKNVSVSMNNLNSPLAKQRVADADISNSKITLKD